MTSARSAGTGSARLSTRLKNRQDVSVGVELSTSAPPPASPKMALAPRILLALGLLFVFLLGVKGLGDGFRLLGEDLIQTFFAATENPFVGLVVGLLATTLVQTCQC